MQLEVVTGDLVQQRDVHALVNAWNRNLIPWWLLLPQGVSGALKRAAGTAPFRELGLRPLPLGEARATSAGRLPNRHIIHVAGIDGLWRASEHAIRQSTRSAVLLATELGLESLAMPVIGAGSGSFSEPDAFSLIMDTLGEGALRERARLSLVRVVRFPQKR